jgi:hypothetical protein
MFRQWYLAGHAIQYLSALVGAVLGSDQFRHVGFAATALQIVAGVGLWGNARRFRGRTLYGALLVCVVASAAYGLSGENRFEYWAVDILAFGLLMGATAATDPLVWDGIRRLYSRMLVPGLAGALLLLSRLEPGAAGERFVTDLPFDTFGVRVLCMPAVFLLLVVPDLGVWTRRLCAGCLTVMAAYGIFTATRTEILIPIMVLLFEPFVGRGAKQGVLGHVATALAIGLLGVLFAYGPVRMADAVENSWIRFEYNEAFSAGRDREAELFVAALEPTQWVIGKGMGGAYHGLFTGDERTGFNMVHLGHLHLVLKGGVVLAAVLAAMVLFACAVSWRAKSAMVRGGAAYIALFAIINIGHQQFVPSGVMAFFGLSLGCALARVDFRAPGDLSRSMRKI